MAENIIGTISAGRHRLWEVVEDTENDDFIVIRSGEDHSEQVRVARTAVPILITILREVKNTPKREPKLVWTIH